MDTRWKPNVTVAAIIERDGRFLLVEEHDGGELLLNNPAGHLDAGESLADACAREALEETAHRFTPTHLVGVYMTRRQRAASPDAPGAGTDDITYLRFAFCGTLGEREPGRALDTPIARMLWLTPAEIRAARARHRSPLLLRCMEDYLAGQRFPLTLLHTEPSVGANRTAGLT